jgi:hypothetical protein
MLGYQVESTKRQKDGKDSVGAPSKRSAPSIVVSATVHYELLSLRAAGMDPWGDRID